MTRAIALVAGLLAAILSVGGAVIAAALGLPDQLTPYIAVAGLCSVACLGGAYFVDVRTWPAMLAFGIGTVTGLMALNIVATPASGASEPALGIALTTALTAAVLAALATIFSAFTSPRLRPPR